VVVQGSALPIEADYVADRLGAGGSSWGMGLNLICTDPHWRRCSKVGMAICNR